ncbi:MAG: flavin reductase [candidate division WOR-3 bacterium]|nr:flavin reductase [candidate division WOR-3 bacterium]MCX7757844.1 flavin reductase [candidate division WOR-3 bacterium]MDW7987974.1 flavin reductase [candidate division WOR-3 bacterium]
MDLTTLYKISYGMYIIGSRRGQQLNGQVANALIQVTSEPPQVALAINKSNLTHEFIAESKTFTVSILSEETPMSFIGRFGFKSGREINKFEQINYKIGLTEAPVVLDYAIGYLECVVVNSLDCGTHTLFIGKVLDAQTLADKSPMTYAYYHLIKKGKSPKTAPTYIKETKKESEVIKMAKYRCTVCDYVYDPAIGDPEAQIPAGTPFEALPDNWVCPVCGADKTQFEKI